MSVFDIVENGPPIEVFALNRSFASDNNELKINLGVGGKYLDSSHIYHLFFMYCKTNKYLNLNEKLD